MTNDNHARTVSRGLRPTPVATHRFAVGALVAHKIGAASQRAFFRVTRQLPDSGQGLQYRIKADGGGQERVALESALERVT